MSKPTFSPQPPTIFEFQNYKSYIDAWIASRPGGGRGEKSRIAGRAKCQLAYVSQVLKGTAHLSLEQTEALSSLFDHTEDEAEFFILLVQRARAGTQSLEHYFDRKLQKLLNQRLILKNRFTDKKSLNREDQATYYSDWAYCAAHMAVLVPELRTLRTIAENFGISTEKTGHILAFLETVGLVERKEGGFFPGSVRIHLENDSPLISKHHTNWRLQAMHALERETPSELHYSSVISVAREDLPRIREVLVKAIEQARAIVKDSRDAVIYCYDLDFFGLGRN
ncbi:TIGR02147 family protein [Bdellovibrionota bacterium FG-1]